MRLLLLGDFNGEVGSVNSPAVGQWAPATENDGGMRLRQFAEAHQLVIASTFNGNGDATSWVDAFGGGHRIDYVVCEEDLFCSSSQSWVDRSIDLATAAREDHRVVGHSLSILHSATAAPVHARKLKWDPHLMKDVSACSAFQRHI